jgi:hypothetical protein
MEDEDSDAEPEMADYAIISGTDFLPVDNVDSDPNFDTTGKARPLAQQGPTKPTSATSKLAQSAREADGSCMFPLSDPE